MKIAEQSKSVKFDTDMLRLSRSKHTVDLCPNSIRKFNSQGLPLYRHGKIVFFSRNELETFIRVGPEKFKLQLQVRG